MEKLDNEKVYHELITVEMIYDEIYLTLHHKLTVDEAIKKVSSADTKSCFAIPPEAAILLANELVSAAYYSKINRRERKQKNKS